MSNLCEGGVSLQHHLEPAGGSRVLHRCPVLPPAGLQLGIKGQMLTVAPGDDITFTLHLEQVGSPLFLVGPVASRR